MSASPHPFRIRDFRAFWFARLVTTIAQNSMVVVIGWQVYDIARRTMPPREAALQLGLVGVFQFVPLLALTLIVGWTADRVDRRWIARAAVLLEAGCAAALGWLAWHDTTSLPALFAVAALLGVARAFASPALSALAPNLVPAAVLPNAIALSSIAWQTGAILGPAAGGYLYAHSHWLPYAASGGLFALAFVALLTIRPVPRTSLDGKANPWAQMVDGLRYVRHNRLVLGAISLDLFAVLLGGATAMLPIFARDVLAVGPAGLGHLRAAPAVGAALVALWFAFRPLRNNVGIKMLGAVAVFGAATIAFGLSRWLPLSLGCLALLGAADMFSVYVRQSLIQIYTPDAMRGRVGAVSTLFISGSNELGEAESGFLAALVGPVAAVVAGGVGAIAVTLLWARWFPEISRAKTFAPPQTLEDIPVQENAK
ncbi:Predicted arabinose efflux permease, MFS family [Sphingomonas laterariae]|uniref:Predicted arabinose efflux permease, MFS family n=1 Tax=Edaphosphingomonas laterariae TaxID=861865 RepID=A0A239E581_9SPHN|nr:MFS transporter [Sphingomonas laterariae]SNS39092.1 Predicted arabinose efflux permease, MFS family [Sphingomonas laterariae]